MAKTSQWNVEKRYEVVNEMLSQKEPIGQIARPHQVSERLIYQWLTAPDKLNAVLQWDFYRLLDRRRREVLYRGCDRVSESDQSCFASSSRH